MPSTVIRSITYDKETNELTIAFVSGLIYVYSKVPKIVYENFKTYREKGIYFNKQVKGKYPFTKRIQTF